MRALPKFIWACLIAVLMLAALAAEPASADESSGQQELDFITKLNEVRVAQGIAPLATKGSLFDMARVWSGQMQAADGISHNPSLTAQSPAGWRRLGENVGVGYSVQSLHDAFVASPHHYQNMVDPQFDSVGVGVVHAPDGKIFVTVDFMTTGAATATATAPAPARKSARVCRRNSRGARVCRRVPVPA